MRSGPVRRIFAWFGLIAMAPIAYMVFNGSMTASDGGMKAVIVLVTVFVAVRIVEFLLATVAGVLERQPVAIHQPEQR